MGEHETIEPEYTGTVGGAYSTEEHLRAQQEQKSATTGQPLIDPADVVHPDNAGDHDDPTAPESGDTAPTGPATPASDEPGAPATPGTGDDVGGDKAGGKPLGK